MIDTEKAEQYIHDEEDFEQDKIPEIDNDRNSGQSGNKFFDILKSKTGEGTIQDYQEHPLNFSNNKYIGQILRGLTGILGALDLAIIDIGMGILGLIKDRNNIKEDFENV
jgi:hypothetical protein